MLDALALVAQASRRERTQRQSGVFAEAGSADAVPTFQAAGWPIGSGSVESANKVVVEARLKGAGMHWERDNVNPMLVLRNAVCNGRWDETWKATTRQRQHSRQQLQDERTHARCEQALARFLKLLLLVSTRSTPRQSCA